MNKKGDPVKYLIAVKYIESLEKMVSGDKNKTIYMPYEATGVLSSLGGIKELLANNYFISYSTIIIEVIE